MWLTDKFFLNIKYKRRITKIINGVERDSSFSTIIIPEFIKFLKSVLDLSMNREIKFLEPSWKFSLKSIR